MTLHTISIDLDTLEIEYNTNKMEDEYFEIEDGHVEYNKDGWGNIYCEASSKELACRKVFEYCLNMSAAFNAAAQEIALLEQGS